MIQPRKVRILIVDDNPAVVEALGRFVGKLSFEAVESIHPLEALLLASRQDIQIALIDLHMPEMEGFELMQSLRRLNEEIKVILITGDYCMESAVEAIKQGAYDFLPKPIDFRQLGDDLNALRNQVLSRYEQ